ncbi:hypothetical protein F8154_05750 [Alkaliphilus pronyensis]|uniref:Uncharacterized protein n=1 Tax=Alkaliphilus pronyensis TaxID=1482732 RepID=A0A6I0FA09_9FIRM|nr:hypothetical protein [Alkaliphilus pronyensis]KAB3535634.1 hypothetical protein F8154_05750 [Alkaliphilus pronyensis]
MQKLLLKGVKLNSALQKLKSSTIKRINKALKNEKGAGGVIEVIIFACLVILAIIAIRPEILGVFSDVVTSFRTWINDQLTNIFS